MMKKYWFVAPAVLTLAFAAGCSEDDETVDLDCDTVCGLEETCQDGTCALVSCTGADDTTTCTLDFNSEYTCEDNGSGVFYCRAPAGCTGDESCADMGRYCDTGTDECVLPDATCYGDLIATPGVWSDGPVIYGGDELDLGVGSLYAEGGARAPAAFGFCAGSADNFAHAWRINYYDPDNAFPLDDTTLLLDLAVFKTTGNSNDQQAPNAIVFEDGATATGGQFVFYLCLGDTNVGNSWAIQYDDGTDNSGGSCFDIAAATHVCTGTGCP